VESKVGGGDEARPPPSKSRRSGASLNDEGIQTDGTLVLLKGFTITLHMREDSGEDVVIRADLSGEGMGIRTQQEA
jgi:hypothetical protein